MTAKSGLLHSLVSGLLLLPLGAAVLAKPLPTMALMDNKQTDLAAPTAPRFVPDLADRDRPHGRRRGGSSRGKCAAVNDSLMALVPVASNPEDNNSARESILVLTTQATPSFWFYVPYPLATVDLEFVLQDADGNILYQDIFNSNSQDIGVVEMPFPPSAPTLGMNQRYQWYLNVECDVNKSVYVQGWVERVPLDARLSRTLAETTATEQAAIYASYGLWPEAITLLGEQYRTMPDSPMLARDWYSLLESVDLEPWAQAPLTDCCNP